MRDGGRGRKKGLRQGGGPGIDIIERGLLVSSKCHVVPTIAPAATTTSMAAMEAIATTAAAATATAATVMPTVAAALVKAKTREMMDGC